MSLKRSLLLVLFITSKNFHIHIPLVIEWFDVLYFYISEMFTNQDHVTGVFIFYVANPAQCTSLLYMST